MRFLNCSLSEATNRLKNSKIIFFGAGSWLKMVNNTSFMTLSNSFSYVIDNNYVGKVKLGEHEMEVFKPEVIVKEKKAVIVLTSVPYMYEMYKQLDEMDLSDDIECYAFAFMQKVSKMESDDSIQYRNLVPKKIPKKIHSFWFSGEDKPVDYQRCIDTWHRILTDYEIIEWNQENYDWEKNPFMKAAIKNKAWAYATDYARLDVVYEMGGIYLDADVEMIKPFDDLLGNEAMLSFSNNIMIDLAVFGARKGNSLIGKLKELYENVDVPENKQGFFKFYQLSFIRDRLAESGICMDGRMQQTEQVTVFPSEFFMPEDNLLREPYNKIGKNTYCIHHANCGWNPEGQDEKLKKRQHLWKRIQNHEC